MEVGKPNCSFYDLTEHIKEPVHTNEHGWGDFRCNGGSVSVWVERDALHFRLRELASPLGLSL